MFRPLKMIKKSLFVLPLILMFVGICVAQDGLGLVKQAYKALSTFNLDPANNEAKLDEAKTTIDKALNYPDTREAVSTWQTKGEIYFAFLETETNAQQIGLRVFRSPVWRENDDLEIIVSFKRAFDLATKNFEKSDALRFTARAQSLLYDSAVKAYEQKKFVRAYLLLISVFQGHDLLAANGQKSTLDEKQQYESVVYLAALSALNAKRYRDAGPLYEKLVNAGTNKPEIYIGLITVKNELGDPAGAEQILIAGQKKFPDNSGLLFAMINLFLKQGKFDEIVEPLQQAIAREPTNISLYTTLGGVYEKLLTRERESGNAEAETQYFGETEKIYQQALEKAPRDSDALYSLGSLYYNKAALLTEGEQTDDVVTEIMALFDQALPYFQKAESVNANDQGTLGALFGIYSAKKDGPITAEFKRRLETVQRGGKNASSYFK